MAPACKADDLVHWGFESLHTHQSIESDFQVEPHPDPILHKCKKHGLVPHFVHNERGFTRYRCKLCNAEGVKRHRNKKKQWCIEYLGGKCARCGYDKCAAALEFHHRNPEEKEFQFSQYQKASYERLARELEKCELLCSNCHKEEHYG